MLANGVKETTATTGTGMVTLSQQSGFVRFSDVFSVGRPVHYAIQDGNNWEWGIGEVGASNTLLRSTILATLSSGVYDETSPSALSLSGSAVVMCAGTTQAMMRPCLIAAGNYIGAVTIPANYMDSADFGSLLLTANRTYVHPVLLATAGPIKKLGVEAPRQRPAAPSLSACLNLGPMVSRVKPLPRSRCRGQQRETNLQHSPIHCCCLLGGIGLACCQTGHQPLEGPLRSFHPHAERWQIDGFGTTISTKRAVMRRSERRRMRTSQLDHRR